MQATLFFRSADKFAVITSSLIKTSKFGLHVFCPLKPIQHMYPILMTDSTCSALLYAVPTHLGLSVDRSN